MSEGGPAGNQYSTNVLNVPPYRPTGNRGIVPAGGTRARVPPDATVRSGHARFAVGPTAPREEGAVERLARSSALALATGLLLAAILVAVGALSLPDPAHAGPTDTDPPNGCSAAVTGRAEPDTVRICDPSDVTLNLAATCPICPGGMRVVFVQREVATESRWMNNEAMDALESLRQAYTGPDLQAAVVQYGPGRSRVALGMTDKLDQVRSALGRSTANANPPDHNNAAAAAAREAIRQLEANPNEDGLPPCKMVLFFAQDSPTPG